MGNPGGTQWFRSQDGRVGWMILLWLVGIPLPVIFGLFLLRGCQ